MRGDHLEGSDCWCRPGVSYVDGVGIIRKHRAIRFEDVDTKFRIHYNVEGEPGWWRGDVVPFIHTNVDDELAPGGHVGGQAASGRPDCLPRS